MSTSSRAPALLAAAVVVVLLLVAVWVMPVPDTGGPPVAAPEPAELPARVVTRPLRPLPPAMPVPVEEEPPEEEPESPEDLARVRVAEIWEPPPLDRIYRAESRGLGEALLARRDRFRGCWGAFLGRASIDEAEAGRFTLELSVTEGGDAEAAVVSGASDAELERCVADSVGDATFEVPAVGRVAVVWPVPIERLPGEP